MKEDLDNDSTQDITPTENAQHTPHPAHPKDGKKQLHLSGMYQNWFIDYASYVILERAVPHIEDGLKPVQRRLLHAMKEEDNGRLQKVAGLVGATMKYHPHGDASIGDALVALGQKELLIDTQGNWGNILTGHGAAAPRYIEARLSQLALDVLYSPKVTDWIPSYDGVNQEPRTLPVKFPLLLTQGVEGIAVGLSCKILPHNFCELLDAAVAYLNNEPFELYPDFQTGGLVDVTNYRDGERGGSVRVRAKIDKLDNKTIVITDLPYGKTAEQVCDSITNAFKKGKIKIKNVTDYTSEHAEIVVTLQPGVSSDKTIDALYAFTDCEVKIAPNCCVIKDHKPQFLTVSDVLKYGVERTKHIFEQELTIQRGELMEQILFASLEKIFITERIYKDKEFETAKNEDKAVAHIDKRLEPYKPTFYRPITRDDILRLMEIRMKRILKYNADHADDLLAAMHDRVKQVDFKLAHLTQVAIDWYKGLKEKYGANYPRRTQVRSFDTIVAAKVAEANEKLYIDREGGFIGTSLKKCEFVCNCSDMDDIIIFYKSGKYKVVKVAEKLFVDKNIIHISVYKRNDLRTIYNVVYLDGKGGDTYMKRFAVTGVTRDKEYDVTQGKAGSKIMWFTANSNGEAEVLRITLKPKLRLKVLQFDIDLADLAIKGKQSRGNLVTKNEIHRITLKERGGSTLGGREVWFDPDVLRLNYDGRGQSLGEFFSGDRVLVVLNSGEFYTTSFDPENHYEEGILRIEKYKEGKVWTAILDDADARQSRADRLAMPLADVLQGYTYIKRFTFEDNAKKQSFIGVNPASSLRILTDVPLPRYEVRFADGDAFREPLIVDADEFIGTKGFKAKGCRLTTFKIGEIVELEPRELPEQPAPAEAPATEGEPAETAPEQAPVKADEPIDQQRVLDEFTGQTRLFDDEDYDA